MPRTRWPGHRRNISRYRIVRTRLGRFLLQADDATSGVEFRHAVTLRITHPVTEHGGTGLARRSALQDFGESMAVENVVAEHQAAWLARNEIAPDQVGLCKPVRTRLHRVLDAHSPLRAVTEQMFEQRLLMRGIDHQYFADSRQHQHAERVVDHRLVINRQQLLADRLRDRIQPCAGTAGKNDALAWAFRPIYHAAAPIRSSR